MVLTKNSSYERFRWGLVWGQERVQRTWRYFFPAPLSTHFSMNQSVESDEKVLPRSVSEDGHCWVAPQPSPLSIFLPHFLMLSSTLSYSPFLLLLCPLLRTALSPGLVHPQSPTGCRGHPGSDQCGTVGTTRSWETKVLSCCPSLICTSLCDLEQVAARQWASVSSHIKQE